MAVVGVPLIIDGSHGEGGASLIRTALAMASLTQQPMRIVNIRAESRRPGLSSEDVAILKAFGLSCGAQIIGGAVGDRSLSFIPTRKPKGLNEKFDVPDDEDGPGHANAVVILNSLLPVMARTGVYSSLSCRGETYGNNVLSYDYFANVTLAALRKFGLYAYPDLMSAGFGIGSRGETGLEIEPSFMQGVVWEERGRLLGVRAAVVTAELPETVGARGVAHLARLGYYSKLEIEHDALLVRGRSPGAFTTVWAEFENGLGGATAMGARGVTIEAVVQTAFDAFIEWMTTDSTIDPFLADQLLLPAVLSEGETKFKVSKLTERFLTVVWVIKQFLPIHITVKGHEGEPGIISIRH